MATDIAFAVGVVALVGPPVTVSVRLFLLTLAVVDDIGAIIVIAVFYSSDVALRYVGAAVALAAVIAVLNWRGVVRLAPYVVVGALLWLTTYASGVHGTIAGVALGLLMPVGPAASPGARLDRVLQPWSTFLVLPVFALANAGVVLSIDAFGASGAVAVTAGVVLGLVAGKTFGIAGAMWLGVRGRLGLLPEGATWPMMTRSGRHRRRRLHRVPLHRRVGLRHRPLAGRGQDRRPRRVGRRRSRRLGGAATSVPEERRPGLTGCAAPPAHRDFD